MMISRIEKLISIGRLEQAIEELLAYPHIDNAIKHHVLLQSAKLQKLQKDRIDGILNLEDFRIELAKVNHSVLEILKMINEYQEIEKDYEKKGLNIVKLYNKENTPFPLYSALIANNTSTTQILYELEIDVVSYMPWGSIPKTRELSKIATWDVYLSYGHGKSKFFPPNPVIIDKDDAAMIDLRFYCEYRDKKIHPHEAAHWKLLLTFCSDKNFRVQSDIISL